MDEAIDHIAQLLEEGQAAAVIEPGESALRKLVGAAAPSTIPPGTSACCGTGTGMPGLAQLFEPERSTHKTFLRGSVLYHPLWTPGPRPRGRRSASICLW